MSADTTERLNAALSGRYRLERELGAGGMATVYLAHDERHDRPVAVKVLKPELAAVMGADRFLTEIRTTANLQHPHILALFDSGEADGFLYYVMPYVEGETLRDLLDRERQLPVDDAVRIAKAVASALDYAHRQNVIHRDIKPANILLHDGEPVVADFGIALAVQQAGGGRLTETGLSLGTPYYMSPEQATADRDPGPRSDVYSLGCVLYEMLAGEPPFQGGTAQAVLGRILTGDVPSVTEVRKTVPRHVDATITRALQRLPADRFATAAELGEALSRPGLAEASGPGDAGKGRVRALLPWGVAAAALVVAVVSRMTATDVALAPAPVTRSVLDLPDDAYLDALNPTISDDGRQIIVEVWREGRRELLRRPLDALAFEGVPASAGAQEPVLSPDGESLVYTVESNMVARPLSGGPPLVLTDRGQQAPSDWAGDGYFYYTQHYRDGISRVPEGGGTPELLSSPDDARRELAHWHPQLLPGGQHVLFTVFRTPVDSAEIAVLDLETREITRLFTGGVTGRYVSTGHILFARNDALFAVPFDLASLSVTGAPSVVVEDLAIDHVNGKGAYAVSDNGTLVYIAASDFYAERDLLWVDRQGNEERVIEESGFYSDPALSPDGRRLALSIIEPGGTADVWVLDLARQAFARLTTGGGADFAPVWTDDGRTVIYTSETPVFDLFTRPADGSRPAEPLLLDAFDKYPIEVRDGVLTYDWSTVPEGRVVTLALDGSGQLDTVLTAPGEVDNPSVSPDGGWIAYSSDESGMDEVYVSRFPDVSQGRQQVSTGGGREPRWVGDGLQLVFRAGPSFVTVRMDPATGEPTAPEVLFPDEYVWESQSLRGYDVTEDGERFVVLKVPDERRPRRVMLVTSFFQELRQIRPD